MEQHTCRQQLAQLLAEEAALLSQLEQQLAREHEQLRANDVEQLELAAGARQLTIAKLLKLDDERASLCRLLGHGSGQGGLASLLTWCDPAGTLAAAQSECAERAGRCRAQNDRNGALVTARLNRVAGMLEMIAGNQASRTYAPHAVRATAPAGRMVSVSA